MIYEFAVEPTALGSWNNFRYIVDQFGIDHGRLISRFPGMWKKMVYEACSNCKEVERKRIEEKLKGIDSKLLRNNRIYDADKDWLTNAENQQLTNPFRAIIASNNPRAHDHVILAHDLDDSHPLWKVDREISVHRKAAALAKCASKLLFLSKEILFIDPYFNPEKTKFMNVMKCFLEFALQGVSPTRIEVHSEYDFETDPDPEEWKEMCQEAFEPLIPKGMKMKIVRWTEKFGGEKLHARYLLANIGGLRYETGLDEGKTGETTDVSILDIALYEKRWTNYQKETAAYDLVDEFEIEGVLV